jgi:hypothetical protein
MARMWNGSRYPKSGSRNSGRRQVGKTPSPAGTAEIQHAPLAHSVSVVRERFRLNSQRSTLNPQPLFGHQASRRNRAFEEKGLPRPSTCRAKVQRRREPATLGEVGSFTWPAHQNTTILGTDLFTTCSRSRILPHGKFVKCLNWRVLRNYICNGL